jgi:hypothetical protein
MVGGNWKILFCGYDIICIPVAEGNTSHCPLHTNRLSYNEYTIGLQETKILQDIEQGLRLLSSGCGTVWCSRFDGPYHYCLQVKEITTLHGVTYQKTLVIHTYVRFEDISRVTVEHMSTFIYFTLQHRILEISCIQII